MRIVKTFAIAGIASLLLTSAGYAQSPSLMWAKETGGTGTDEGNAVAVDGSGNVFSLGTFYNTVDFDPGPAVFSLTSTQVSSGWTDIFLRKMDASGNFVWADQLGGNQGEYPKSITIDASGNILITGYFNGTADFDPGPGVTNLSSAGGTEIFICKLDTDGKLLWAKKIGGVSNDMSYAIAADASGNVYTTGSFLSTVDFDPGAGTSFLTSTGSLDIFVNKLDTDGNFVWAKKMGGASVDYATAISVDASGNVYTTGSFAATADFDPGAASFTFTSAGSFDHFVSKLDGSGAFVWAKQMAGTADGYPLSMTMDPSGNIITAGYFWGVIDFDPGPGVFNLTAAGLEDIFVSKLDNSGNFVWARQVGGSSYDECKSIAADASGNVYLTGFFIGTVDFDPGAPTVNLVSNGSYDIFISKLDASGNFAWAENMGGPNIDIAYGVDVDISGHVFTVGSFGDTADFGPGACVFNLTTCGSSDIFVEKLSPSPVPPPTITGFNPTTGPAGTSVIINGTNFNPAPENNSVWFNGVPAVVTASSATAITVVVPIGTITGPIKLSIACNSTTSAGDFTATGPCYLPQSERNALIDLYNASNGAGWTNSSGWMSVDESTWHGITVLGCRVNAIDLSNNQLNGSLPASITNLTSLQVLKVGINTLSGALPANIGDLISLKELSTQGNTFNGLIPASLANCTALETLQLNNNQFGGSVPAFLGAMPNLKIINLGVNGLSGNIPSQLGAASALTYLSLASNYLDGTIPPELGSLASLSILDLSHNQLTGPIPPEMGDLSSLTSLQLWDNQLSGPITGALGNLSTLQFLNLSKNQLSDIVPASLANLSLLNDLSLNDNLLTGDVPVSIGSLTALSTVNLAQNGFATIPAFATTNLHVENNNLDFGSLEPNMGVPNFTYSPQAKLPPGGTIPFTPGGSLSIPFSTPGSANQYQWFKGVDPIPGASSATLVKPNMTVADVGLYYIRITSSIVPGLTLESLPYLAVTDPCTASPRTAGDLDLTFDPLIDAAADVGALGMQSTGKIIVSTAATDVNGTAVEGIIRFNSDGSLDGSFSTTQTYVAGPNQLIVQPDDKILTTYYQTYVSTSLFLTRLEADGSDDTNFNSGISTEWIFGIGLQPDGNILLSYTTEGLPPALSRLFPDGSQDVSFSAPEDLPASVIKVQSDGNILLGGSFSGGIVRLDNNGAVDPAFTAFADGEVTDIAIQADGKIIVAGPFNYFNNTPSRGIVRINTDGSLDNSFNTIGISDDPAIGNFPNSIAIQSNGKIILAGIFDTVNGTSRKNMVRLNTDGEVDCLLNPGLGTDTTINSMILQPDGRILVGGSFSNYDGTTRNGFARINNGAGAIITITVQPKDTTVCEGINASFTTAASGTTNITYQWQFSPNGPPLFADISNGVNYSGTSTATLTVNTASSFGVGRYRCRINGDLATEVITNDEGLFINPLPTAPGVSGVSGCSPVSLTLTATGGTNGDYRWYTAATGGSPLTGEVNDTYVAPVLTVTTTYYVSLNDGTCESVRVPVVATVNTVAKPIVITSNCTATQATLAGPNGFANYAWSDGENVQQIVVTVAGSYTLVVTDAAGCSSPPSDPAVFTATFCNQAPVVNVPPVQTVVEGSVEIDLVPLITDSDNNLDLSTLVILSPPTSGAKASIDASYRLKIDYAGVAFSGTDRLTLQACDMLGACTQKEISIEVIGEITVYNALSPTGDNKNEVFFIQYVDILPNTKDNKVTIYNRWGDLVYETENYDNANRAFRGVGRNGDELPSGTYFYKIDFVSGEKSRSGFISLRR